MKTIIHSQENVFGVLAMAWVANYIAAKQFGYPFLYCWLSPIAATLYLAAGALALYVVILCVIYNLFLKSTVSAVMWALMGLMVIELPRAMDYIFRLGASCD